MRTPRIEKQIPLPPIGYSGRRNHVYPWKDMEVDDSFLVRCADTEEEVKKTFNNLTKCRALQEKARGTKYALRHVRGGIRVWRTK